MKAQWRIWTLVAAAAGLLSGCVVAPVDPYDDDQYRYPPQPRVESRGYPPAAGYLWLDGYWMWGTRGYEWMPGYWVPSHEHQRALMLRRQHEQQRELMMARERARAQELARARAQEQARQRAQERERDQQREWMRERERAQQRERDQQRLREREHQAVPPNDTRAAVRPERSWSRDSHRHDDAQARDSYRTRERPQNGSSSAGAVRPSAPPAGQPTADESRESRREYRRDRPRHDHPERDQRGPEPDQR